MSDLNLISTPASSAGKDAPSPALAGPIRFIVRSAHKWGGDGAKPDFNKIKRVLMEKHPDVIARVFGGDANKAAAWIKDNWEAYHGRSFVGKTGAGPTYWRKGGGKHVHAALDDWYEVVPDDAVMLAEDQGVTHELFCDGGQPEADSDGLVWKTAARTGTWKVSPLDNRKPLVIDKALLDDIEQAFNDGAWEHVTIPLSHKDRVDENTGYVKAVKVVPDPNRPGEYILRTGMKFTEPEIEQKVRNGSIANCSVGVSLSGVTRTEDGKHFPRVLKHVALTNRPWLNGLTPFGTEDEPAAVAASLASYEREPGDDEVDEILAAAQPEDFGDVTLLAGMCAVGDLKKGDQFIANGKKYTHMGDHPAKPGHIAAKSSEQEALVPFAKDMQVRTVEDDGESGPGSGYGLAQTDDDEDDTGGGEETKPVGDLAKGDQFMSNGVKYRHMGKHPSRDGYCVGQNTDTNALKAFSESMKVKPLTGSGQVNASLDLHLGWMPDNVKESDLDDGDFAVVSGSGDQKVRKLPYKIHGTVNVAGWKAAWSRVAHTDLPAGVSMQAVRAKLLRDKPKGVEVDPDLKAALRLRTKGGDNMPDEILELTKDDLQEMIAAAIAEDRADRDIQLDQATNELHALRVKERVSELQQAGYAPAVVKKAEEFYLADQRKSDALTLSREDEEVHLSITDVVNEMLEALPKTALNLAQPKVPQFASDPKTAEDPKEIAARVMDDLKNGNVQQVAGV